MIFYEISKKKKMSEQNQFTDEQIISELKQKLSAKEDVSQLVSKISNNLLNFIEIQIFYTLPIKNFLAIVDGFKDDLSHEQIRQMEQLIEKNYGNKVVRQFLALKNIAQSLAFVKETVPPPPPKSDDDMPIAEEEDHNEIFQEEEDFGDPEEEEDISENINDIEDDDVPEGLLKAIWIGDIHKTQEILDSDPTQMNQFFNRVGNALHCAIFNDRTEIVEMLLNKGANAGDKGALSQTPLHYACQSNITQIFDMIIASKDVDINAQDDDGDTALIISARRGKMQYIKALVEKGALLDLQNNTMSTALHYAAKRGDASIAKILLDANADFNLMDENNKTPFLLACENQAGQIAAMISSKFAQETQIIIEDYSSEDDA